MKNKILFAFMLFFALANVLAQEEKGSDYEVRPFQVTFITPLGTNGTESSKIVNNFSVNILAGYNGGVDGFELGSFLNLTEDYVEGFQVAGFGNIVGGSTEAIQLAGFMNLSGGPVEGFQTSGFINIAGGDAEAVQIAGFANISAALEGVQVSGFGNKAGETVGAQIAGFGNVSEDNEGIQIAGFMNLANEMEGIQLAGFLNATDEFDGIQTAGFLNAADEFEGIQLAGFLNATDEFDGIQTAGFLNATDDFDGIQIAGFLNTTGDFDGIQIAGFLNASDDFDGIRIAGFLNAARNVKGIQIAGFINICDTIDGIPIAPLNIVKKGGYRRFEFWGNETFFMNASFKIGIRRLYTIFSLGYKPVVSDFNAGAGFGVGTNIDLKQNKSLDIEMHAYHVNKHFWENWEYNQLNMLKISFNYQIADHFSIFAGPSFNLLISNFRDSADEIAPSWAFNIADRRNSTRGWFGFNLGMRF